MGELVGVHGMAKHRLGRYRLIDVWAPALADGLERAAGHRLIAPAVDLAFYGDVFLPADDAPTAKSADDIEVFEGLSGSELAEVEAALREVVTDEGLIVAEREVADGKGYTRVPRPLQALLRAVDNRCGVAAGIMYVGVVRQVHRYLSDPQIKAAVDERVVRTIDESSRVLIGHSLGSIVAYEYLRQHPGHEVALFLTLGSPLGLRMVRSRLRIEPLSVPAWVNVRDLRDPVACAGALTTWWPQIGASAERVVDNGMDTHAAEGYLSRGKTGRAILDCLPHLADT